MKRAWLVRHKMLNNGEGRKPYCLYYLNQPNWAGGVIPLPFTSLAYTDTFRLKDWWRLQKKAFVKILLEFLK